MTVRISRRERSARGPECFTRNGSAVAALVFGLLFAIGAGGTPASAQGRGKPDPIDQSKGLSTKPLPSAPAPDQPRERLVPEKRHRDPHTGGEVVVPPHYERPGQPLPVTGDGTKGPVLAPPGGSR